MPNRTPINFNEDQIEIIDKLTEVVNETLPYRIYRSGALIAAAVEKLERMEKSKKGKRSNEESGDVR